jgi:hypothetical protein
LTDGRAQVDLPPLPFQELPVAAGTWEGVRRRLERRRQRRRAAVALACVVTVTGAAAAVLTSDPPPVDELGPADRLTLGSRASLAELPEGWDVVALPERRSAMAGELVHVLQLRSPTAVRVTVTASQIDPPGRYAGAADASAGSVTLEVLHGHVGERTVQRYDAGGTTHLDAFTWVQDAYLMLAVRGDVSGEDTGPLARAAVDQVVGRVVVADVPPDPCALKSYLDVPHLAADPSYDASSEQGRPLAEVTADAGRRGVRVRVIGQDGRCFGRDDDYAGRSRLNVYVEDTVVRVAAYY